MTNQRRKKYVLIIPDGAADLYRALGRSPLAIARTSYTDFIARNGVCGLMQTLYSNLPKESIVAQLGMLGWDPQRHYPHGRASCELLALEGIHLNDGDLAFRANLVQMEGRILKSYNANYILSQQAVPLIQKLNSSLRSEFPDFELHHSSDFRNTLVVREAGIEPSFLRCPEPHENHGGEFDISNLISAKDARGRAVAARINNYLVQTARLLEGAPANMIFPWSASSALHLPPFGEMTGFDGRVAVVGCMDFLHGIAKAGKIDFYKEGNGRPDTDYQGKGKRVVELLSSGYEFVVCHINSPDEASHMSDLELKIKTLEMTDRFVVRPIVEYFQNNGGLGGVLIAPDHYTNGAPQNGNLKRVEIHSAHPVPFALWNGYERDAVRYFSEDDVLEGRYGKEPISHLDLLRLLGVQRSEKPRRLERNLPDDLIVTKAQAATESLNG